MIKPGMIVHVISELERPKKGIFCKSETNLGYKYKMRTVTDLRIGVLKDWLEVKFIQCTKEVQGTLKECRTSRLI